MTNITTVTIPCRAKDPSTCKYHSAQARAEKALAEGRIDDYLTAQIELAAAIKTTREVVEFFQDQQEQAGRKMFAPAASTAPEWQMRSFTAAARGWLAGNVITEDMKVLRDETAEANHGYDTRKLTVQFASRDDKGDCYQFNYRMGGDGVRVDPDSIQQVEPVKQVVPDQYRYGYTGKSVSSDIANVKLLDMLATDIESGHWQTDEGKDEMIHVVRLDDMDEDEVAELSEARGVKGQHVIFTDASTDAYYSFSVLRYPDGHVESATYLVDNMYQEPVTETIFVPRVKR